MAQYQIVQASPGNNFTLYAGDTVLSTGGGYTLVMQGDGNLVLYPTNSIGDATKHIWQTYTDGKLGLRLAVQEDGNVVL